MQNLIAVFAAFLGQIYVLDQSSGCDSYRYCRDPHYRILLYHILVWFKTTRAWTLFKGILVILVFILLAAIFQMNTILWIADKTINNGSYRNLSYFSAGNAKKH